MDLFICIFQSFIVVLINRKRYFKKKNCAFDHSIAKLSINDLRNGSPKKYTHPQAIQEVDEFVSSSEQFGEIEHYITCTLMDPLQSMGAIRMRVQTADKNSTIIHTTPVHQLMSCEMKSCVFVWKMSSHIHQHIHNSFGLFSLIFRVRKNCLYTEGSNIMDRGLVF